jgi:hypothetical protein
MKGLIVFIDILGYQSFLENNSAEDTAEEVLEMIEKLPEKAGSEAARMLNAYNSGKKPEKQLKQKIEHVVFSDTIVLLLKNEDKSDSPDPRGFALIANAAATLVAELFSKGLPSRCVVHEGEFINKNACLAGRGIAQAYRLCGELDLSGVVLSESVRKFICGIGPINKISSYIIEYLVPLKDGKEKTMLCLNWHANLDPEQRKFCDQDVIQFVSEAFWKHDKDIPISVDSKIRNTCKLIRKFIMLEKAFRRNVEKRGIQKKP